MSTKKLFSLESLTYLTVAALPVYLFRFSFWGVPTNLLEVLIALVFVGWLFKIKFQLADIWLPEKKILLAVGFIFSGLLISTLVNPNPLAGLGIIKSWFVFPWLFVLAVYNLIPKSKRVNVFKALGTSSLAVALVSLGYWLTGRVTYDGRLEAFFNSPNYLAMYLAPGAIIGVLALAQFPISNFQFPNKAQVSIFNFKNNPSKIRLFFLGLSLAIISLSIYLTYSYAAWLALIGALLLVLIFWKNISWKKLGIAASLILALVVSQLKNPKFIGLINLNPRSSLASRFMIWRSAGRMLEKHWLFGIGPANFQAKYLIYQKYFPPYLEWAVPHPQNVYLAIWLYSGLLGFLGFLALLYFYFQNIFRKINSAAGLAPLELVSLAIILYFLLHGLVDTTILKNDLAVVFWLGFLALE